MTIAFKKAGTDDITYTLDNSEIRFFRSVKADGGIYLADDGVAILGAVVTGVLESAWESVSVNLVFKSDSGNTLQKLSVSASHTK